MFKLAGKFLQHVIPGVARPLHILWNQIIGFFFLALAGMAVPSAVRDFSRPEAMPRLVVTLMFIAIMTGFGIHSFLKARKVSRSS
jgi:hypothetical protein